ncbi:MAG: hypothetical protein EOM40_18060 [Clostridia bacterium]|nr:hypothetical protein [Clostridia bacterium]NCC43400.1 hypothetical protein [Clostridia bacterium]
MYGIGILSLALGLTLNTKTQLGTSPIISVPYTISCIWQLNFGNLTLIYYTLFVIAQFIIKGKNRQLMDVLQIPFSIVFTRFLNLFDAMFQLEVHNLWQKLLILAAAILFTGIGVVLTVNMKLIVNPGDGIVQAIAGRIKKSMGLTKNIVDFTCLIISCLMGFVFAGRFTVGIGLGTVIAMICVGRVIAVLNFFFKKKMQEKAGLVFTEI